MSIEHHLLTASVQAEVVSKLIRLHFRSVSSLKICMFSAYGPNAGCTLLGLSLCRKGAVRAGTQQPQVSASDRLTKTLFCSPE